MRIAHVLTFVSEDGSFGGPVAVADAQTRELARRGHEVHLLAGWDGKVELDIPGVTVHLFRAFSFPGLGFSGMIAPKLFRYLRVHASEFDVIHIHMGRHAISLTSAHSARKAGVPYVLQTHGMVMPDKRPKALLTDLVATRVTLAGAQRILALTESEEAGLSEVSRRTTTITRVRNGIAAVDEFERPPGHSRPEVLFLARLHERKRVMAFAEMALLLERRGLDAAFNVIGPDEGELNTLIDFIRTNQLNRLAYQGSIPPGAAPARLARASVFVLPSVGEVFPMTVLESLSVGTPVVLTSDSGISSELETLGAAIITDGSPEALATAVEKLILHDSDPARRAHSMRHAMESAFSISAVASSLEAVYSQNGDEIRGNCPPRTGSE
jgi:glycosyltransferase involved in cell wall biosynthesis